jgi:uncharacterized protein
MRQILYFLFGLLNFTLIYAESVPIKMEHAMTPEQRSVGLMGRQHLEHDQGMLFHFPSLQVESFWMYGTFINLSIAFLDENSLILEIYEMQAYPDVKDQAFFVNKIVSSKHPVRFALEMNKNWFAKHSIKPGDRLIWNLNESSGFILKK